MARNPNGCESWRDIPEYKGSYQVSCFGRVRSTDRIIRHNYGGEAKHKGVILRPSKKRGGYLSVYLSKDGVVTTYQLHRLVATIFLNTDNNRYQVNHKNGIKDDNRVDNLEWCNPKENIRHAIKMGLMDHKGEKHKNSKLKDYEVRLVKQWLKEKVKSKHIAEFFGVTHQCISDIKRGRNWRHIKI